MSISPRAWESHNVTLCLCVLTLKKGLILCVIRWLWELNIFPLFFYWRIDREGNGNPLQYSCLENPMDGGAWWAAVHGVARSWTQLSNFTSTFHFHALEEEMATHSSVLAWRIPGTGEPGVLPSMGSHRVGHDWSDLAAAAVDLQCRVSVRHMAQRFSCVRI